MLLTKTYFLIIQGIILISFLVLRLLKKENKYFIFPSKIHFIIYLTGAITIGYFFNSDYQLFCIPVKWTKILLITYSFYLIGNWIFKKFIGETLNQIILGAGLFISIYIILFGSTEYLIWSAIPMIIIVPIYFLSRFLNKRFKTRFFDSLNFYGATILLPYIVIAWIIWQAWDKRLMNKISLAILPLVFSVFGIVLTIRINSIIDEIANSNNKYVTTKIIISNTVDKYLTELILGAHWKYHTKICLYDGWRPPFHDPILGFAQPILYFGEQFNYEMSMPDRVDLYKRIFPDNRTKFDCKCAKNERLEPL